MRHYELVAILSTMLNQDEASALWGEIKTYIANRDGEITAEQVWGTRRLAYPIRKGNYNFLEGSYYLSSFTAENPFNRELENYLRLDERVLRSLIVRCEGPLADKPPPGPLTAPSRYIPPGRPRRNDGGGPIPESADGFGDRRRSGPPGGGITPATPAPAATPAAVPVASDAAATPVADTPAPPATTPAASDATPAAAPTSSDTPPPAVATPVAATPASDTPPPAVAPSVAAPTPADTPAPPAAPPSESSDTAPAPTAAAPDTPAAATEPDAPVASPPTPEPETPEPPAAEA